MRARPVNPTSEPANEPLTLAEAKAHLRVDYDDDDVFIAWAIKAARRNAETFTRRYLITQTVDFFFDRFPSNLNSGDRVIRILRGGSQSVTSVKYYDTDGAQQTLVADTDYRAYPSVYDDELRIGLIDGKVWPEVECERLDTVEVRAVMGYGDSATDVPDDIIHAIRLTLGDIYEHRENTIVGTSTTALPFAAKSMLYPYQLAVWGAQQ